MGVFGNMHARKLDETNSFGPWMSGKELRQTVHHLQAVWGSGTDGRLAVRSGARHPAKATKAR